LVIVRNTNSQFIPQHEALFKMTTIKLVWFSDLGLDRYCSKYQLLNLFVFQIWTWIVIVLNINY
jgi:hypothetical protein